MSTRTRPEETGLDELDPGTNPARDAVHFRRIIAARKKVADAEQELRQQAIHGFAFRHHGSPFRRGDVLGNRGQSGDFLVTEAVLRARVKAAHDKDPETRAVIAADGRSAVRANRRDNRAGRLGGHQHLCVSCAALYSASRGPSPGTSCPRRWRTTRTR